MVLEVSSYDETKTRALLHSQTQQAESTSGDTNGYYVVRCATIAVLFVTVLFYRKSAVDEKLLILAIFLQNFYDTVNQNKLLTWCHRNNV